MSDLVRDVVIQGACVSFVTTDVAEVLERLEISEGRATCGIDVMASPLGPGHELFGCCLCFHNEVAFPGQMGAELGQ